MFNLKYFKRSPKLPLKRWPKVSVLIPARNEEKNIGTCLNSILAQDYPNFEIIVLNDNSTDSTAEIIKFYAKKDKRIKLITGKKLPKGWTGKSFACMQLSKAAKGDWFLFTDADTNHQPHSLSTGMNEVLTRNLNFITILPNSYTSSFRGKLFLNLINFVFAGLFHPAFFKTKNKLLAYAIGPYILVDRKNYEKANGHESVRQAIVDDVQLSREVKQAGGKVGCIKGIDLMDVKFYTTFKEFWNGFSKNTYESIGKSVILLIPLVIVLALPLVLPQFIMAFNLIAYHTTTIVNMIQMGLVVLIWVLLNIGFKSPLSMIITQPFSVIIAIAIIINSARLNIKGIEINWKGRNYSFHS